MSKPIEPGCLAIILRADERPELVGACVKILYMADTRNVRPHLVEQHGSRWWALDLPVSPGALELVHAEQYLLRIDGGEDESVTERRGEEVSA